MREYCPIQFSVRALVLALGLCVCSCEPTQQVSMSADGETGDETLNTEIDLAASWGNPAPPAAAVPETKSDPGPKIEVPKENVPPLKPYRNRSDAALLERFEGQAMHEILDALLPTAVKTDVTRAGGGGELRFDGAQFFSHQMVEGIEGEIKDGVVADFAGDDHLDVLALGRDGTLRLFVGRQSDGKALRFELSPDPVLEYSKGGESLRVVDFDGDSNNEVMVLRGAGLPSSLLNCDGGKFQDLTIERGLLDFRNTVDCRWFDLSGDRQLDLLMANIGEGEICALYIADSDGKFVDRAEEWGLSGGGEGIQCVGLLDADGDGSLDVLLNGSPQGKNSAVGWYRRGEGKRLEKIALQTGMPRDGMKVADLDNDGREDLLLSDGKQWSWWRNTPGAEDWPVFENVSESAGLQEQKLAGDGDLLVADFDGDGHCDLLGGKPLQLLLNRGGSLFVDAGSDGSNLHLGDGDVDWMTAEDFDADGDLDVLSPGQILSGRATEHSQWIRLRSASHFRGSMLTLTTRDKSWIQATIYRRIDMRGHSVIPIGLGEAETVVSIEVDGWGRRELTEERENVRPRQTIPLTKVSDKNPVRREPEE